MRKKEKSAEINNKKNKELLILSSENTQKCITFTNKMRNMGILNSEKQSIAPICEMVMIN